MSIKTKKNNNSFIVELSLNRDQIDFEYSDSTRGVYYHLFTYPYKPIGQFIDLDYYGAKYAIIDTFPSFQINGNNFNSVAEIYHTDHGYSYHDYFYVSAGVGIVKMNINHFKKRIWELVRYNIVK